MRLKAERDEQIMRRGTGNGGIDAPQPRDELEIFHRRQLVVDHRFIRDPRRDLLGGNGIAERVDPEHRNGTGIGPREPCHHAQRGRLAGTVGSDQPDLLAWIDLERGVDEQQLGAVLFADVDE